MQATDHADRAAGAVMGALIGDALAVGPHWYYDLDQLRRDYGPWIDDYQPPRPGRYHEGLSAGDHSQTGQVAAMLLESVAKLGGYDRDDFTRRLDDLLDTLDGTPEGGRYTDEAMREVWTARKERGEPWSNAGSLSDTAEAAIRAPVLAARYADDLSALREALIDNVRLTHAGAETAGQSMAFGLVTAGLIRGMDPEEVSGWLREELADYGLPGPCGDPRRGQLIDAVLLPAWTCRSARGPAGCIEPAIEACRLFGLACSMRYSYPAALYLAARFEGDFEKAVLTAVNGGGNNMSRAALTGALCGAMTGLSNIPERFIVGLEDGERLRGLALDVSGRE
ncbi:ADP-ribosylglycohydrolase family protein [Desulfohalovibrio reitneri]|uniref:ADP-ribosylglycohydrolase family protein n=1 Tax=Desulfohalovibrio reitneri TaxID=1307759 RepID=UPI0004A70C1A|nr:ADP-ribosylglycohydrolase family protein [Desulfohalovibrio reitneri]